MPYPMKIQPVDSDVDVAVEAKPGAAAQKPQSLLKRLFEKQFPGLRSTATAATTTSIVPRRRTVVPIGIESLKGVKEREVNDFEPSSVCLVKMVQNFLEESGEKPSRCGCRRCHCFNGNCDESSSSDDDGDAYDLFCADTNTIAARRSSSCSAHLDPSEILKSLVLCATTAEKNLLTETARAMEINRKNKGGTGSTSTKIGVQKRVLVNELIKLGFDSAICKSRCQTTSAFLAGEYEYIDVIMDRDGERILIDIDFKSEFEIARPTKTYRSLVSVLPTIFVGKPDRVKQIVNVMSEAAKQSMKKKGLHIPPWRKPEYMRSKWVSPHQRLSPPLPSSPPPLQALLPSEEDEEATAVGVGVDGVKVEEEEKLMVEKSCRLDQRLEKSGKAEALTKTEWHPPAIDPKLFAMDLEVVDHKQSHPIKESWKTVLMMSYQSLGVVYGDLSTSPLYVYKSTFADDITHSETNEEIFGVVSFVFWTLTLIPLLKYVFILLRVNDNGEGGTFALYSLLCRHAKLGFLPNSQVADEELSAYKKDHDHEEDRVNLSMGGGSRTRIRRVLEKHRMLQQMLLLLTLLGTCMVIGDGIFTPAISVFSAVSGLQLSMSTQEHKYIELPIACIILVGLFALQHYGTRRIGFLFAPIVILWLLCISMIGIYNIIYWNPRVYQAISPYYMYKFLKKTQKEGWMSLGGILLCMTGSEAMFADLGHFSHLSIKIAFTFIVYPSLILAYMGQAAYLSKHHILENNYHIGFYVSVPERLRWPTLVIAIMAAVVGSQAVITGTFSIIKQCTALGCFPRVKIIHTSSKVHGQIYIPEINWILMILSLAVTVGFRDTKRLGNAVGLAVITVMLVTTCLMSLVIILCWNKSVTIAICFVAFFGTIESLYFSASLIKFREGAWLPITLSIIFMLIMYSWHYGSLKKYEFDLQNKVSIDWILGLGPSLGIVRVNGIGLISTDLVSGIPAIFSHFVTNLPAFHQVLVFLCVKSVHVPYVQSNERFLVGRIGPREYRLYRCIVRYGYHDIHKDDVEFEKDLVCSIAEFIQSENSKRNKEVEDASQEKMEVVPCRIRLHEDDEIMAAGPSEEQNEIISTEKASPIITPRKKKVRFLLPPGSPKLDASTSKELQELSEAREAGVAFIASHSHVRAKRGSGLLKKLAINFGYDFLSRNSRGPEGFAMNMSGHANTLEVGMVYLV